MARSVSSIAASFLFVLLMMSPGVCSAGPITYTLNNYPHVEFPYQLSGSITTDGHIGQLTIFDILSWNYTITQGPITVASFTSTVPGSGEAIGYTSTAGLFATATALQFLPGQPGDYVLFDIYGNGRPAPDGFPTDIFGWYTTNVPGEVGFYGHHDNTFLWSGLLGPRPHGIEIAHNGPAGAPEPSTFTLLAVGVAGLGGYAWRRRKRVAT
jgi:hypothetical protein